MQYLYTYIECFGISFNVGMGGTFILCVNDCNSSLHINLICCRVNVIKDYFSILESSGLRLTSQL